MQLCSEHPEGDGQAERLAADLGGYADQADLLKADGRCVCAVPTVLHQSEAALPSLLQTNPS